MKFLRLLTFSISLALLAACATAPSGPEYSEDGLKRVDSKDIDSLYWKEGATLSEYEKIAIARPEVSFRKNWMRDQNSSRRSLTDRIQPEDMERISTAVADLFVERFSMALTKAGYDVTDQPASGVLELVPSIVDLDVTAPDISRRQAGMSTTYTTDTTGEMTLQLEILDAPTQSLIGRATDRRKTWGAGTIQVTNSITNRSDAIRILDAWAKQLVEALDTAHQQ